MSALQVWAVDPLEKVFGDDRPPDDAATSVEMHAVRNQHANAQVAVRARADLEGVEVSASALEGDGGEEVGVDVRRVGYVPVEQNTPDTPPEELVREAPAEFPDPLLEETTFDLGAGETRPVWLTFRTPEDGAGTYEGTLTVDSGEDRREVDLAVTLHPATLGEGSEPWLLNYLSTGRLAAFHDVERWSEPFWDRLAAYAENMASHRQNVINASLHDLVTCRVGGGDADLSFDFERFDRFVETFEDAGVVGRVSAGSLARKPDRVNRSDEDTEVDPDATELFSYPQTVRDAEGNVDHVRETVRVSDPAFEEFLAAFLPAFERHLEERGWLDATLLDIADEPTDEFAESYNAVGELVREHAPRLKTVEPTSTHDVAEYLDVWVPMIQNYEADREFYEGQQAAGDEVWHYTALSPRGRYPNRFVDFSLVKVRVLQWLTFAYDLEGFLHWGYNYWTDDPYDDVENEPTHPFRLPPGDPFIVYPGEDGPVDSLRWEATRASVDDYELLCLVAEREGREAALELCERVATSATEYVRDPAAFREVRDELVRRAAGDE
ncbi:MAG: glycoside hydrolase domain-containing protein [Halobacteriaceae archaeon]